MNARFTRYYLRFKTWLPKPVRSALSWINQRLFARRSVLRTVGAWYDVDWRKHYQSLTHDQWSDAYDIVWRHRHNDCVDETDTALILSLLSTTNGDHQQSNPLPQQSALHPADATLSYNDSYHDQSYHQSHQAATRHKYRQLSAQLSDQSSRPVRGSLRSVLEVGCGAGSLAIAMAQAGFDVTCVDVSRVALDIAAERARKHGVAVRFEHGFAEQLPFADKSFDAVTCCHTLEHVRDLQAATSELQRVARHRIIVVVPKQEYRLYAENYHTQFFTKPDDLVRAFGIATYQCHELNFLGRANEFQGEALLYVGELHSEPASRT